MRPLLKYLTAVCSAALLLACADVVQRSATPQASAAAMLIQIKRTNICKML